MEVSLSQPADLLIHNARVFTADPANPHAEVVAIRGNHIVFVGPNSAAEAWRGPNTRLIDGQQCSLLPGFIDSHFHLFWGSIELGNIQLNTVNSLDGLTAAIQAYAQAHPDSVWLVGRGLQYSILPQGQSLTRHQLDAIIADRPLIVFAYDGHTAWANTAALRQAGILSQDRPVGPNSEIVRDVDGSAAGELRESGAFNLILDLVPPPTEARQRELLQLGLAQAAALGVTSVHNMNGDAEELAIYLAAEAAGDLTLRVYCPFHVKPETPIEALAEAVAMRDACTGEMVRSNCVKFFMDGVIETYTGLLLDDYAGQPGNQGGALFTANHFTRMATEADRLGLQIFVHAVGDGAVRRILDSFAAIRQTNGHRDSRHRIEHIELIHPDDLPRFAELGVIASMQPAHAILTIDDPDPWPRRIPESRWGCAFAWQTIREAGAKMAFGSDWPVATPSPFTGIYFALNRQPWAPGLPHHRQTLSDTLLSYTRDAAYAEFQEYRKGQLRPGMLADLVLLSDDIFAVPPDAVEQIKPEITVCDGKIVYEK